MYPSTLPFLKLNLSIVVANTVTAKQAFGDGAEMNPSKQFSHQKNCECKEDFDTIVCILQRVDVPVFDNHYIDFLGLLKEDGNWLIVNKMYTTLSEE